MMRSSSRKGAAYNLFVLLAGSVAIILGLSLWLFGVPSVVRRRGDVVNANGGVATRAKGDVRGELFVYCAAGMRYPMEQIVARYQEEYATAVQLLYGGSNTLLNQLEISKSGDLYLAADESYIRMGREKGLITESLPIAKMRPVIVVRNDTRKNITSIGDLLGDDVKVALGNPDSAAIGMQVKRLLSASGQWADLERRTKASGVFKPTVNEVANDVKLGSVDAGIVWDSTAAQYPELRGIRTPELDAGSTRVEIGIITTSKTPTAALHFARYVTARDRGLTDFGALGWETHEGDVWADRPELTLFAGSVNRRALEPIIQRFQRREGVTINTIYDGCGILTARMRAIREEQSSGFPDTYMACDVYYLNTVKDMFQDAANVSDTDIVIAVAKGNPKRITSVEDLLRDDVRVVLGHPDQCTIGVLSRRLLQDKQVYASLMKKDVPTVSSSAMLITPIATGAADAVLAYFTDTRAESDKVDTVPLNSDFSKAIQPFAVARSSDYKYLSRRLYATIARSRDAFEAVGFNWRLDGMMLPSGGNQVEEY